MTCRLGHLALDIFKPGGGGGVILVIWGILQTLGGGGGGAVILVTLVILLILLRPQGSVLGLLEVMYRAQCVVGFRELLFG